MSDLPVPRPRVIRKVMATVEPGTSEILLDRYVPVDLVRNGVTYIILYSMFATLLFVLLCAVLFKNGLSPQKRKLSVVWVLGLAMIGGMLGSTLNTVFWAYQLFGSSSESNMFRLWMASSAMLYVVPLVTHVGVQLRLMSFYPPTLASRRKRIGIIVIPTILKAVRLAAICTALSFMSQGYKYGGEGWALQEHRTDVANMIIFVLQFVDTFYASCFLLWKFHCLGHRSSELMSKKSHRAMRWTKQIIFAMAFGYILPTLYSLALVLSKILINDGTSLGFVLVANVYVQAFGAVLATLSRAHRWRDDRYTSSLEPGNSVVRRRHSIDSEMRYRDHESARANKVDEESDPPHRFVSLPFHPSNLSEVDGNSSIRSEARASTSRFGRFEQALFGAQDPTRTASNDLMRGDISPKAPPMRRSHQQQGALDSTSSLERAGSQGTQVTAGESSSDSPSKNNKLSLDMPPSQYALQQLETRRSSDATLFPPTPMGDATKPYGTSPPSKLSGSSSRPGSRPESGGTGRRLGLSHSIPKTDSEPKP